MASVGSDPTSAAAQSPGRGRTAGAQPPRAWPPDSTGRTAQHHPGRL